MLKVYRWFRISQMKLDNLTPEQRKAWTDLVEENHQLKEQLARGGEIPLPALLTRPEFVREVARMAAYDQRYNTHSHLINFCFEGLYEQQEKLGAAYFEIVQAITDILTRHVRASDVAGRTGANDFCVALARCDSANAHLKAEAFIKKIQETLDPLLCGKVAIALRYSTSGLKEGFKQ